MRKMLRFRTDYFLLLEYFSTNHIAVRLEKKRHSGSRTDHLAKKIKKRTKQHWKYVAYLWSVYGERMKFAMLSHFSGAFIRSSFTFNENACFYVFNCQFFLSSTRVRALARSFAQSFTPAHFPWNQLNLNWIRTTKWQPKIKNYERKNKQITTIRTKSARLTVIHATTT